MDTDLLSDFLFFIFFGRAVYFDYSTKPSSTCLDLISLIYGTQKDFNKQQTSCYKTGDGILYYGNISAQALHWWKLT